jgi:hypothetical protein
LHSLSFSGSQNFHPGLILVLLIFINNAISLEELSVWRKGGTRMTISRHSLMKHIISWNSHKHHNRCSVLSSVFGLQSRGCWGLEKLNVLPNINLLVTWFSRTNYMGANWPVRGHRTGLNLHLLSLNLILLPSHSRDEIERGMPNGNFYQELWHLGKHRNAISFRWYTS